MVDRLVDDMRLIGDEVDADPDRQIAGDLVELLSQRVAEFATRWRLASC